MGPHQILRASLLAVEEMRLWGLAGAKGIAYLSCLVSRGDSKVFFPPSCGSALCCNMGDLVVQE
jgi:hypothetical protein